LGSNPSSTCCALQHTPLALDTAITTSCGMFSAKSPEYNPVSLDEFSDDDSLSDSDNRPQRRGTNQNNGHRTNGHGQSHNGGANSSSDVESDGSNFRLRQQQLLQQQDMGLDMLGQQAQRLGQMSLQISEELDSQNKILSEMDQDLDEANQNLDLVTRKTKEFIEASGGTRNFLVILALICVVIILILMILYL
jgi:SNARE domain